MHTCKQVGLFLAALLLTSFIFLKDANAQSRRLRGAPALTGDMAIGIGLSTVSAGQDDMNKLIDTAVTGNGASTKNLGSAWEVYANWTYRFSGTAYSLVFRPSYFTQTTDGSGTGGNYDYKLTGFTVFPIFRLHPLENDFIKFYMQAGLGYGTLNGDISAGAHNLQFKGSAFGVMGGIGVDFCFTYNHCLNVEGNLRYMPIERNLVTGGSCSASGDIPGVSQCGNGNEVETMTGKDLGTTMSGVQGVVGYTMRF